MSFEQGVYSNLYRDNPFKKPLAKRAFARMDKGFACLRFVVHFRNGIVVVVFTGIIA
ncbi:hypothetical protein PAAL109150_10815 [Paenibacillus alkaliterrae]